MSEAARVSTSGSANPQPWHLDAGTAARLEAVLRDVVDELAGDLLPAAAQAVSQGGKRLRPALTLAVATSRAPHPVDATSMMQAAGAVELLHRATLVHDDLLDGATRRHGTETINAGRGPAQALLTGDLLIATAHVLAARSGPDAALLLARTLGELCRGEALQARQRFDADVTATDVTAVARLKTGSLLHAATVLGGALAGYDDETRTALGAFGSEFGVALQIVDDLLDVTADAETLGKPVGADFAGGTVTLPAVAAMQRHPELRELLHPDQNDTSRHRALRLLRCPHAVRVTRDAAYAHAERAAAALRAARAPGLQGLAGWPETYVRGQLGASAVAVRETCRHDH